MSLQITTTLLLLASVVAGSYAATPKADGKKKEPAAKVAWYGQLKDGLAEAKRSQRPVLLVSAAPQCKNVSGMW